MVLLFSLGGAAGPGGLIFLGASALALESAAAKPFAFAIQHPADRLAAGRATVVCLVAAPLRGGFIAPRPRAQGMGKKFLLRDHAPPQPWA